MSYNKKLVKAGSLYFIGNIFDKAVAFITVPIFTRMLSTSDYGVTTIYLSWVSILSVIITLSVGISIRTAVVDYADDKDRYISSIFSLGTISAFLITAVVCCGGLLFGNGTSLKLILLCCLHSYSTSIITAVQWRYMMDVKYLQKTVLQCLPNMGIITLSIFLISSINDNKYLGRVYSYALVMTVVACFYLIYYLFKGRTFYKREYWKYALGFSIPIIFHSLSTVILSQADRIMITWLRNVSETGIYGLAYQFGMVPLVITTTFENIWIPWFTEKMENHDKLSINSMVRPYTNSVAIMCAAIMFVAPEVLKWMTIEAYFSAIYIIAPVVAATYLMFLASVSLGLEYYLKKTKTIAVNTLIAACVNIILNLIFIPKYGGIAAAYATVASYAVSFIMHYTVARKLDRGLFDFKVYVFPILLLVASVTFTTVLMDYALIRWGIGVVLGIMFCIMGYRFIKLKNNIVHN